MRGKLEKRCPRKRGKFHLGLGDIRIVQKVSYILYIIYVIYVIYVYCRLSVEVIRGKYPHLTAMAAIYCMYLHRMFVEEQCKMIEEYCIKIKNMNIKYLLGIYNMFLFFNKYII